MLYIVLPALMALALFRQKGVDRPPACQLRHGLAAAHACADGRMTSHDAQGSAADIAKLGMIAVDRRLAELGQPGKPVARLILHIHDELLFEVEQAALPRVAAAVKEAMEAAVPLAVPLPVKLQAGRNWGEMREWAAATPP